ncbi:MAG: SoxR reducing system RseC family protein [Clostridia bacterium]|nr:SoxR reducing system RseC family protein [Clostridia bacterium]
MLEVGFVESVNEHRGTAKVVFDRKSACDKCRMCLTASGEKMKVYVEVKNTLGAKVGDKVGVTMSDRFVLRAAFIVYVVPVLLVGAGLAIFRKLGDLLLLAVVAVCLLLGIGVGIFADRMIRKRSAFAPTLSAIYDQDTSLPATSEDEGGEMPSASDDDRPEADPSTEDVPSDTDDAE